MDSVNKICNRGFSNKGRTEDAGTEDAGRGHLSYLVLSALSTKLSLSCSKGSKTGLWKVVNGEACFRAAVLYRE